MTQIIENDDCGHLSAVPELGEDKHDRTAHQDQGNSEKHFVGVGYDCIAEGPDTLDGKHQFIEYGSGRKSDQPPPRGT